MFLTNWSLVYSNWRIVSYACHNLPEEESKVHGDEDQYHKVIQEANDSKYSLWYQVKGGEEIEQPHCSQENYPGGKCAGNYLKDLQPPAPGTSEVKGKVNVRWLKVKEGSAVDCFRKPNQP